MFQDALPESQNDWDYFTNVSKALPNFAWQL
jgi:hypothetical protein